MTPDSGQNVAIVVIGRNEGDRLKSCLRASMASGRTAVYADSGSDDGSADYARSLGCHVVEVDPARPFSAARARNEGIACLLEHEPEVAFVQFVDGDCDLEEDWLERGAATLREKQNVGVVFGHLREVHPEATIYNRLCDLEWRRTPGEIRACGGIFMVRAKAFKAAGGFRDDVIAAEDDELCVRMRQAGWKILLVDAAMARHDAAITRFSEWWQRTRRTGHAYAHVAAIHGKGEERYFVRDCRKVWVWALLLPVSAFCLAPFTYGFSLVLLLGLYALQFGRIYLSGRRRGWGTADALIYAMFTVIAKFPMLEGLLEYYWRQRRGHAMTIIEYKGSSSSQ
jgi:GT2 family glycosyltransferase